MGENAESGVVEKGCLYNVYNRVGGGSAPFAGEKMAQMFISPGNWPP